MPKEQVAYKERFVYIIQTKELEKLRTWKNGGVISIY